MISEAAGRYVVVFTDNGDYNIQLPLGADVNDVIALAPLAQAIDRFTAPTRDRTDQEFSASA